MTGTPSLVRVLEAEFTMREELSLYPVHSNINKNLILSKNLHQSFHSEEKSKDHIHPNPLSLSQDQELMHPVLLSDKVFLKQCRKSYAHPLKDQVQIMFQGQEHMVTSIELQPIKNHLGLLEKIN